jgi:hypothetical protein
MVDLSTPKAAASTTCVMPGLARTTVSTPNDPGVKSKSASVASNSPKILVCVRRIR